MQFICLLQLSNEGWLTCLDENVKGIIFSFLSFILSFSFAKFVLPHILQISQEKQLFDSLNDRKSHKGAVSRLGGVVFMPAIVCSLSLLMALRYVLGFYVLPLLSKDFFEEFMMLISGATFLYLVGVKDDLVGVRYRKKFMAQFLVASLLPLSGLYFNQLYGFLGLYEIPAWIGMPLTTIAIVFITNSINLIDGIDGLAAGGTATTFLVFGILFMDREFYLQSMLAFSALGALLPFSYYNLLGMAKEGNKLFMGDAGSLTLGYLIAYLSLKYAMYNPAYYITCDVYSLLLPISLLFLPCFDAIRVMVVRIIQGKSMFLADRNHIHHLCLSTGMSHPIATGFLLLYNILLLIMNVVLIHCLDINYIILIDMLVYLGLVSYLKSNRVSEKKNESIPDKGDGVRI